MLNSENLGNPKTEKVIFRGSLNQLPFNKEPASMVIVAFRIPEI